MENEMPVHVPPIVVAGEHFIFGGHQLNVDLRLSGIIFQVKDQIMEAEYFHQVDNDAIEIAAPADMSGHARVYALYENNEKKILGDTIISARNSTEKYAIESNEMRPLDHEDLDQRADRDSVLAVIDPDVPQKIITALNRKSVIAINMSNKNAALFGNNPYPQSFWTFKYNLLYGYKIVSKLDPNIVLGVRDNSVVAEPDNGSLLQRWRLDAAEDNRHVYIRNTMKNLVMDVKGSNTGDNTDIILYENNGASNKKFRIGLDHPGLPDEAEFCNESYSYNQITETYERSGPYFLNPYNSNYDAHLYFVALPGASGKIIIKRFHTYPTSHTTAGEITLVPGRTTYLHVVKVPHTKVEKLYPASPSNFSGGTVLNFEVYRVY